MSHPVGWFVEVQRIRASAPEEDQYGEPIPGSGSESVTPLPDALFAPGGSSEPVAAGESAVVTQPTVYWPKTYPDILPTDQLRIGEAVYRSVNRPWPKGLVVALKELSPSGESDVRFQRGGQKAPEIRSSSQTLPARWPTGLARAS